jgi:hypothetical protein
MTVQASDANTERVFSKGFAGASWNGTGLEILCPLCVNLCTRLVQEFFPFGENVKKDQQKGAF